MIEALIFLAEFATLVREDPISGEKQAVFATVEDGHTLAVACEPGSGHIDIRFVPNGYFGAAASQGIYWRPRAESRFKAQKKPDKNSWTFHDSYLAYNRPNGGVVGAIKHKARFLDRLATDDQLAIRYEARPGDTRTVVFKYDILAQELGNFIARCAPDRVIKYLEEWDSPAAPNASAQ